LFGDWLQFNPFIVDYLNYIFVCLSKLHKIIFKFTKVTFLSEGGIWEMRMGIDFIHWEWKTLEN